MLLPQKIFSEEYCEQLRCNVATDYKSYSGSYFNYNQNEDIILKDVKYDESKLYHVKCNANEKYDYEAAIALYETYEKLSLIEASYAPLWIHLAHVELYEYMIKRFPDVNNPEFDNPQYILDHWFFNRGSIRQHLSGLYWSVRNSVDENLGKDRYKYTKCLFNKLDFRTRRLASSSLFRCKEVTIGVLMFMLEYEDLVKVYYEGRANFIAMYLNHLGAIRQLSVLSRDDIFRELESKIDVMNKITSRESGWYPSDGQ